MIESRSPVKWIGGKSAAAARIIAAFPPPDSYSLYIEPCGGAAHVLLAKPRYQHKEVYNDLDDLLVNFWWEVQRNGEEVCARLQSLLYARKLYYDFYHSLYGARSKGLLPDPSLSPMEKAVRWLYILRSNMTGFLRDSPPGWNYANAETLFRAADLIEAVQQRFRGVAIDNRDVVATIKRYEKAPAAKFFYIDPPYIEAEQYYPASRHGFDHEALAATLHTIESPVAVSYYAHPLVDQLYPASKWRRLTWQQPKLSSAYASGEQVDRATELLLMNYPPASTGGLWEGE